MLTSSSPPNEQRDNHAAPDREAERIYFALFRRQIPDAVRSRFDNAVRELNRRVGEDELRRYRSAIGGVGDLEAIELACRYTRTLPTLCERFRLMVYLGETIPQNQDFFIGTSDQRWRAWWDIFAGAWVTAFKLAKGWLLLKRIRHA